MQTVTNCDEVALFELNEVTQNINRDDEDKNMFFSMQEDQLNTWANYTALEYVNTLENYGFTDDHFLSARLTGMSVEGEGNKDIFKNQIKEVGSVHFVTFIGRKVDRICKSEFCIINNTINGWLIATHSYFVWFNIN